MTELVLKLMLVVACGSPGLDILDKSWTSRSESREDRRKIQEILGDLETAFLLAEGEGFEPTNALRRLRFSRPVQSTTLPSLQFRHPTTFCPVREVWRHASRRREKFPSAGTVIGHHRTAGHLSPESCLTTPGRSGVSTWRCPSGTLAWPRPFGHPVARSGNGKSNVTTDRTAWFSSRVTTNTLARSSPHRQGKREWVGIPRTDSIAATGTPLT